MNPSDTKPRRPGRHNADEKLLASLAAGSTIEQAAAEAQVSPSTVSRRLADPTFKRRLEQTKDDMISRAVCELGSSAAAAVGALADLLNCDSPSVRLGASRAILEMAISLRTDVELAKRISRLEERVDESDTLAATQCSRKPIPSTRIA